MFRFLFRFLSDKMNELEKYELVWLKLDFKRAPEHVSPTGITGLEASWRFCHSGSINSVSCLGSDAGLLRSAHLSIGVPASESFNETRLTYTSSCQVVLHQLISFCLMFRVCQVDVLLWAPPACDPGVKAKSSSWRMLRLPRRILRTGKVVGCVSGGRS